VPPAESAAQPQHAGVPRPREVRPVRLSQLPGRSQLEGSDVAVTGVTHASAAVLPGDLFAAVPGRSGHGARFAAAAAAAGASAVLTDGAGRAAVPAGVPVLVVDDVRAALGPVAARIYGDPSAHLAVLGITGTSGKTTTAFFVRAGLQAAGRACALMGTVATLIGEDEVKTPFTTPEAPDLQALLGLMRERGADSVVMEVSSHALALRRADGIDFAAAGFTNLSRDHLDFHASMYDYFDAKARLFDGRARTNVIVVDDVWGERMVRIAGPAVTVSTDGTPATWRASNVRVLPNGATAFLVRGPHGVLEGGCAVPGEYNVANAVLALALLDAVGVPPHEAAAAVATAVVPGRMERLDEGQPFLAVVDYSHKPAAIDNALRALRPLTRGRLLAVLGCGGDRDREKRPLMGEIAARGADLLVVTDDNPRSEDPAAIRRAVLAGAMRVPPGERGEVREIGDRAEAIRAAVADARPGDTVLVAGKGHETGQEINGVVHPFDDRDVLRAAVRGVPA
jgi:UDP-N-acetylmuramoyl-L-alanyl-D-glutamate--2,6-diaminopimelate ligase